MTASPLSMTAALRTASDEVYPVRTGGPGDWSVFRGGAIRGGGMSRARAGQVATGYRLERAAELWLQSRGLGVDNARLAHACMHVDYFLHDQGACRVDVPTLRMVLREYDPDVII